MLHMFPPTHPPFCWKPWGGWRPGSPSTPTGGGPGTWKSGPEPTEEVPGDLSGLEIPNGGSFPRLKKW